MQRRHYMHSGFRINNFFEGFKRMSMSIFFYPYPFKIFRSRRCYNPFQILTIYINPPPKNDWKFKFTNCHIKRGSRHTKIITCTFTYRYIFAKLRKLKWLSRSKRLIYFVWDFSTITQSVLFFNNGNPSSFLISNKYGSLKTVHPGCYKDPKNKQKIPWPNFFKWHEDCLNM